MMNEKISTVLEKVVESDYAGGYTYDTFLHEIERLHSEGKVTGAVQSPELLESSAMNLVRMKRWDKHFQLRDALRQIIKEVKGNYTWLVISEGWCGDSAQNLPILNKMALETNHIRLVIFLRDENVELMDEFLTNGTRSVPKLVCVDEQGKEVFTWGPRPAKAIEQMDLWKKNTDPVFSKEEIKEKLHLWYARDKGESLQGEMLPLLLQMK